MGAWRSPFHGATRSTKGIDILVAPADLARVLEVIRELGYTFVALPMTFDEGTARERHVQRVSTVDGKEHLLVDLLVADAAFAGALDDAVEVELPEGPLAVVSRPTLIRMKQARRAGPGSHRPREAGAAR